MSKKPHSTPLWSPAGRLKASRIAFPIVVSGPSGVGKTLLVSKLLALNGSLAGSISATSRPIRPGETNGVHYFFYEVGSFENLIRQGKLLEWARVHEHYYGTPREPLERNLTQGRGVVLNIDVQGGRQLKGERPDAVLIFVAPPSFEALETRLRQRGTDTEPEIRIRLANARVEMERAAEYDYLVVNDDADRAAALIDGIVSAEKLRVSRLLREHARQESRESSNIDSEPTS